jgi:integrase
MDKKSWPAGIRPSDSGDGIRIKLWKNGKLVFSETLQGDPHNARDIKSAIKRREHLVSRQRLGLPLSDDDENSEHQLFWKAAQDYMDTLEGKHSTQLGYENILNKHWIPAFGRLPVSEISRQAIKRVLAGLDVANKTKKNILGPLRGVLDHVELSPNPAAAIKIKKTQSPPVDRYRPKERDKLLSCLHGQTYLYFAILFGCGLRPGEALALRTGDFDGEEFSISKQVTRRQLQKYTKTNRRRTVYVPLWVRKAIATHPVRIDSDFFFVNSIGGFYKDTDIFNGEWREAHKKKRLPYRIPYACRHTRAAELLSLGIDPADAAKQMGHSVQMFLTIYSEFIEEYAKNKDKSRFEPATDKIPTKLRSLK